MSIYWCLFGIAHVEIYTKLIKSLIKYFILIELKFFQSDQKIPFYTIHEIQNRATLCLDLSRNVFLFHEIDDT